MNVSEYFINTHTNILSNDNLREPQIQAYAEIYDHFMTQEKTSHAIVVLPTGVGKTGLMSTLPFNISKGRVLIIAPQLTILNTIESSLDSSSSNNFWTERKIIPQIRNLPVVVRYEGTDTRQDHLETANIVIANIQKSQLRNEQSLLNRLPDDFFDMIIIDEAHHAEAKTWIDNLQHFSKAKVIKITATAYRTDQKSLIGELVYKYKLSQAMALGYVKSLEKFDYIPEQLYLTLDGNNEKKYTIDQILDMELKDSEWIARTVSYSDECKMSVVIKSIEILNEKRNGTTVPHKIIASASNIEEAKKITSMYAEKGMRSVAVYNDLSSSEREAVFSDIENHRVDVVVNVSMMGEGYDHKYFSVAAIFRAFKNPLPYEQFIGRILRSIPEDETNKASDNIGSVVAHKHLYLDDLWNYYRTQLQESNIIKELNVDFIEDENTPQEGRETRDNVVEIGIAFDSGKGILEKSVYLETQLLAEVEKEKKIREKKIQDLISILHVSHDQAVTIIDSSESGNSEIKRPDLLLKSRQKTTDNEIRQVLVPELLLLANVGIEGTELATLSLFLKNKYSWIPERVRENGGMLATYFNTYLKNEIGLPRNKWSNSDFIRAEYLLNQQAEYVREFLKEMNNYEN